MGAITTPQEARDVVGDAGGGTGPSRGRELYEFVRRERPAEVLELGFAHGVSTVYLAAALEANGEGRLVSVDNLSAHDRDPSAADLIARAGLAHRVELVYEPTSYNWFLHGKIRENSSEGACRPYLDFCFLDGAHTWVDDGLAFFLVDKLLKPGGWILFDDLSWVMDERFTHVAEHERAIAQVQEIFELLACQHPAYDHAETDGEWGWLRKSTAAAPAVRTVVRRDQLAAVRHFALALRSRLRRA